MALASEFLTYLFKFIVLLVIAIAGGICGARIKKNKIAEEAAAEEQTEA